jgi:hypothetical protein
MLTKLLDWLYEGLLFLVLWCCTTKEERQKLSMRRMNNAYLALAVRKPDKLCEDDACVERIREAEGS